MQNTKQVCYLQLSAGQGPKECAWVVAQLLHKILKAGELQKLSLTLVESLAFEKHLRKQDLIEIDAYRSVLLRLEGKGAIAFAQTWQGVIKWQGESPYRAKHKRLNWFVDISFSHQPESSEVELHDLTKQLEFEAMRASGPGGQHVNKTNSAVRLRHKPSGLVVRVESERSQHRNKQIAVERLQLLLQQDQQQGLAQLERARWLSHRQVQRGAPRRVFVGAAFTEQ